MPDKNQFLMFKTRPAHVFFFSPTSLVTRYLLCVKGHFDQREETLQNPPCLPYPQPPAPSPFIKHQQYALFEEKFLPVAPEEK
jgi:hypothetical protein